MSGIRAQNAELLAAGLTLPGFVERSKVVASLPSLSLLTLAGMTPDEFELEYHEIQDLEAAGSLPRDFDLVAITSLSAQAFEAYRVAARYRSDGTPVVMGGLHATAVPREARAHCDSVVVGEGEMCWLEVLQDWKDGRLQPFYNARTHGECDLGRAPMPRFDLLDPDKYNRLTVQTSRGCPHKCTFCASSILLTPKYKLKPVHKVIEEIHAIKALWAKPFIEFADDNSFVHKEHYKGLLRELAKEHVRWFTECDVSVADDPELIGLMRDAGCQQVLIGLESPTRRGLEGLEGNANWKAKRQDRYLEAIRRIQSHGITVNGCFILGLDSDTPNVFDDVRDFVHDSGLYEVQITFLTPFSGTPLYRRLRDEGRILEPENWDLCTLFDVNIRPRNMTPGELQQGFLRLAEELYSEEAVTARRGRFRKDRRRELRRNRRPTRFTPPVVEGYTKHGAIGPPP